MRDLGARAGCCAVFAFSWLCQCVPHYNAQPFQFDDAAYRLDIASYVETDSVARNWAQVDALCHDRRARMEREVQQRDRVHSAVAAAFAATSALLALSDGIYLAVQGSEADPTVTGLLTGLSGTAVVPSFFYFGSDERTETVRQRIARLDAASEQLDQLRLLLIDAGNDYHSLAQEIERARDERVSNTGEGSGSAWDLRGENAQVELLERRDAARRALLRVESLVEEALASLERECF